MPLPGPLMGSGVCAFGALDSVAPIPWTLVRLADSSRAAHGEDEKDHLGLPGEGEAANNRLRS